MVADKEKPVRPQAWWMVVVLAGLTLLSFIDRNALYLLIEDVKHQFRLTDSQSSLLLGAAFALLYAFAGLPAGHLVDKFSRRGLIFGAVAFWSVMTALSGLATSFGLLFLGRMAVGMGEAFLSPAGASLIRNALPLRLRALAFGILNACSSSGGGVALLVVGGLASTFPAGGLELPLVGKLHVWQLVFVTIGCLGLPLSFLAFSFREPEREVAQRHARPATMAFFKQWIGAQRWFYLPLWGAMGFVGMGTYGYASWMPTALARKWAVVPSVVGVTYGKVQIVASLTGVVIGATAIHFLMQRQRAVVALWATCLCTLLAAVSCMLTPLMPTHELTWAMLALHWMTVPTSGVGTFTALTAATPNAAMGKVMAVAYISHSVSGYLLGPSLVAWVSDHFLSGPSAIGHAVSMVSGTAVSIGLVLYIVACRHLMAAKAASEQA